jgi:hypothetical protein
LAIEVESDHRLTVGQEFRWKTSRLLVPSDIESLLEGLALWAGTKSIARFDCAY